MRGKQIVRLAWLLCPVVFFVTCGGQDRDDSDRETFRVEIEADLDELDREIEQMQRDIGQATEEAKKELEADLKGLKEQRRELQEQWTELENASEDVWGEMKTGFRQAVAETERALEHLRAEVDAHLEVNSQEEEAKP